MLANVNQFALMRFLEIKNQSYKAKTLELRDAIVGWLSYIPQTFPHYTSHTIEHSEEVILQMSKLLFYNDDPQKPVVHLSSVEAYILLAAAYLHDAGMVTSDTEKAEIMASDRWKEWISGGGGEIRWKEIQKLRQAICIEDTIRNFLADVQTRFLIAEFIRRTHHTRAIKIITQHQSNLARFAFDDPILLRSISDICLAHGLMQHELDDPDRFPDRRDIRGEPVNLLLLAIIFRLGDLLDMANDRACPLVLNAACPLPADSLAHWTKYQRINHKLTAPDRIEITADCLSQEEHAYLDDWCQWLCLEVKEAGILISRCRRHGKWKPPLATIEGAERTIKIRPASTAKYIPIKWQFKLDNEQILHLLIHNIYETPEVFIRELIQNALDATRCRMYLDLTKEGSDPPESPTQVNETYRRKYSVKIELLEKEVPNPLSGENELRQIFVIEDQGTGMDREIIENYFLQVGRSYYATDQFRRSFRFSPVSRFGLGFLSVFAVSNHIVVETYKPEAADGPIQFTVTGPKSYFLVEKGNRSSDGTRIEVLLNQQFEKKQGNLTKSIKAWCKRVEFPIQVDDLGSRTEILAEKSKDFLFNIKDVTSDKARFILRTFPFALKGVEGEIYILGYAENNYESWTELSYALYSYPNKHPLAKKIPIPANLICVGGVSMESSPPIYAADSISEKISHCPSRFRLDIRKPIPTMLLSRENLPIDAVKELLRGVSFEIERIIENHVNHSPLANSADGWKYKQELIEQYDWFSFWQTLPQTIHVYRGKDAELLSLEEALEIPTFTTITSSEQLLGQAIDQNVLLLYDNLPVLLEQDIGDLSSLHTFKLFERRIPQKIRWLAPNQLAIDWALNRSSDKKANSMNLWMIDDFITLDDEETIGFVFGKIQIVDFCFANMRNPLVKWVLLLEEKKDQLDLSLYKHCVERIYSFFQNFADILNFNEYDIQRFLEYLKVWSKMPGVPPELRPPEVEVKLEMLRLKNPFGSFEEVDE